MNFNIKKDIDDCNGSERTYLVCLVRKLSDNNQCLSCRLLGAVAFFNVHLATDHNAATPLFISSLNTIRVDDLSTCK